jgi:hypothetical protein
MTTVMLPANTWTLAAPPGFASANVHIAGNVSILYAFSAGQPASDAGAGVISGYPEQMTIGTDVSGAALWLKPAIPDNGSWARVV